MRKDAEFYYFFMLTVHGTKNLFLEKAAGIKKLFLAGNGDGFGDFSMGNADEIRKLT